MSTNHHQVVKESSSRSSRGTTQQLRVKRVVSLVGIERRVTRSHMQVHLQAQCLEKAWGAPTKREKIDKVLCERQRHFPTVTVNWRALMDSSYCAAMQRIGYRR